MPGSVHRPQKAGAGKKPGGGGVLRRQAPVDHPASVVPVREGGQSVKRCVVHFNGGDGYANFPAQRLERLPEAPNMVAALDGSGAIVGIFDLSCVLSIHLSEQKDGGK